jgi:hypothetical protein
MHVCVLQARELLSRPDVVVTNLSDKTQQLAKMVNLNRAVRDALTGGGGTAVEADAGYAGSAEDVPEPADLQHAAYAVSMRSDASSARAGGGAVPTSHSSMQVV